LAHTRRAVGDRTVRLYATKFAAIVAPTFDVWTAPRAAG
jgi:hypothetical protein